MLVFIVPIKSPKILCDWALTSRLFERCVRAICNQTSSNFRVVVVCNERPLTQFSHRDLHYLEVDFPPPLRDPGGKTLANELPPKEYQVRLNVDKARKIRAGLDYAERFNPTHTMVVDADDCVSKRLAEFVAQNPHGTGWYFKTGYFYPEGARFLYWCREKFNTHCGSSVIVAYGQRNLLFANPDFYQHNFQNPLEGLLPLPFPGTIYSMANGDNIYMSPARCKGVFGKLIKRFFSREIFANLWRIFRNWPTLLTQAQRDEFGLYKLEEPVPAPAMQTTARQASHTVAS